MCQSLTTTQQASLLLARFSSTMIPSKILRRVGSPRPTFCPLLSLHPSCSDTDTGADTGKFLPVLIKQ